MKTKAVRLYGANDVRLEEFELPEITEGEILARIVTDSLCMSSYKAAYMGASHNRVPDDVAEHPIILGHEFCGEIVKVGARWQAQFHPGERFTIQPALNYKGRIDAPGYSFPYIGGCATYIVIPEMVMEVGCLLPYHGDAFFYGSLAEPMSCVIGSFMEFYHSKAGIHAHEMGILPDGNLIVLAGAGPMGFGAVDFILHAERRPGRVVVTDIDTARLERMAALITVEEAARNGVELHYVNTAVIADAQAYLMALTDGHGYDDVMVMAPVRSVCEQADRLLAFNGCLSFFSGPKDTQFSSMVNFYNIHYRATHYLGTVGGNTDDMRLALSMCAEGKIDPSGMITHVGGLDSAAEATLHLPEIPGGKKLIYTQVAMPLTAISDFAALGKDDAFFAALAEITAQHGGIWCAEAEQYLLAHAPKIQ